MSFQTMKKILLLLWTLAVLAHASAAETDWRKAAREIMAEQEITPLEIQPGTRFKADLARERLAWMQRVLLPPFEKHLAQWPAQAEAARSFVKQAFMAFYGHPEVDPKRPWEVLSQEGATLFKAGVDDPLLLWLAARAVWEFREGHSDAERYIYKALHHTTIQDYPSMLVVHLNDLTFEMQWPKNSEVTAKARLQRYTEIMKSAPDASVFGPQDDEMLLAELDFIFTSIHDRTAELEKLCVTPHFTPWLREMLQGKVQGQLSQITDGIKDSEDEALVVLEAGPQWIQIDLGATQEIFAVLIWRRDGPKSVYYAVVVQISDDAKFRKNTQTIFNSDRENVHGLGAGTNLGCIESYQGQLIDAKAVKGRYVRLYSCGNTADKMNHYTEVEVWGRPAR